MSRPTVPSLGDIPPGPDDEAYCAACGRSYPAGTTSCAHDGAQLVQLRAKADPLIGRVLEGRYEVRSVLGAGGMGTVYRGWQLSIDREIAIKVIHPKHAGDRVTVKRFLREARLSSRLTQAAIVSVYDFGQTDDGLLFLVMELLVGQPLSQELESGDPFAPLRAVRIAMQLCDALEAAHGQGIIHRDLKPGNIVVLDQPAGRDQIKVLDFGLAKSLAADVSSVVTVTSGVVGTPLYMPPEQVEGREADHRADLYATGCILYHLLAGRPPFLAENANLVMAAHVNDAMPPLPRSVPPRLVDIVARLMAKTPAHRIGSAGELREHLQAIVDEGLAGASMPAARRPAGIERAATDPMLSSSSQALSRMPTPRAVPARTQVTVRATNRRLAILLALALAGTIAAIVVVLLRRPDEPRDVERAVAPIVDAAAPSVLVDAAEPAVAPVDADAAPSTPTSRPRPPRRPPIKRPSKDEEPNIDFIRPRGR